jgi:hypothetical protein
VGILASRPEQTPAIPNSTVRGIAGKRQEQSLPGIMKIAVYLVAKCPEKWVVDEKR